ncbi:hypothetical protein VCV18_004842 [Metarhizium anisopliae]
MQKDEQAWTENSSFIDDEVAGKPKIDPNKAVPSGTNALGGWSAVSREAAVSYPLSFIQPYPCPWLLGGPFLLHPHKI